MVEKSSAQADYTRLGANSGFRHDTVSSEAGYDELFGKDSANSSNEGWSETAHYDVSQQEPLSVQAQYDQLIMEWQEARETAGEEDETTVLHAAALAELLSAHPEVFPEDVV